MFVRCNLETTNTKKLERKILFIEITALLICIITGVLWYLYPSKSYEPIFAITSLIFVATEVNRRIQIKKNANHSFLEIDSENTLLCTYAGDGKKNGHIVLLFYKLKIVNASDDSFTLKDIRLEYSHNSQKQSIISTGLTTGTVYCPHAKKNLDSLILYLNNAQFILMGWENIASKIKQDQILQKNAVFTGSASFILDFKNIEDIRTINDFNIVISDYSKNYSKHPVVIEEKWITQSQNLLLK